MPTYEYVCRDCGHHLEVVQSFRDEPLTTCGTCGGALRKVFSAAGIIFKGSGYYVTDSRAEKQKRAESGAKEAVAKESSAKEPAAKGSAGESSSTKRKDESPSATSSGTAKSA